MNRPELNIYIFIAGCIGALSPEIVRLYRLRYNPSFKWSWFYLIISLLFSFLGGIIAWILPAITYYGAFYAGITTPVFVNNLVKSSIPLSENNNYSVSSKHEIQNTKEHENTYKFAKYNNKDKLSSGEMAVDIPGIPQKGVLIDIWMTTLSLIDTTSNVVGKLMRKLNNFFYYYFQAL